MNTNKTGGQSEESTIEYMVVEDESNVLDEVFNKLFEQIEKEINK